MMIQWADVVSSLMLIFYWIAGLPTEEWIKPFGRGGNWLLRLRLLEPPDPHAHPLVSPLPPSPAGGGVVQLVGAGGRRGDSSQTPGAAAVAGNPGRGAVGVAVNVAGDGTGSVRLQGRVLVNLGGLVALPKQVGCYA